MLARQRYCAANLNATTPGQVIAFVLFVLFCMRYVWSPLMAAIEECRKETADGLASAKRAYKDLDLAKVSTTDQLKKVRAKAQIIIEQANERRAQILDEVKTEAEQERTKIVVQAQAEIDAEHKRACEELCKQVAILAVAGVGKIIERSVDKTVNSDIVDKLVAEL